MKTTKSNSAFNRAFDAVDAIMKAVVLAAFGCMVLGFASCGDDDEEDDMANLTEEQQAYAPIEGVEIHGDDVVVRLFESAMAEPIRTNKQVAVKAEMKDTIMQIVDGMVAADTASSWKTMNNTVKGQLAGFKTLTDVTILSGDTKTSDVLVDLVINYAIDPQDGSRSIWVTPTFQNDNTNYVIILDVTDPADKATWKARN